TAPYTPSLHDALPILVADFEKHQKHAEEESGCAGAPTMDLQMTSQPKRHRRNAIAIEDPVQDRRCLDNAAHNAGLPRNASQHERSEEHTSEIQSLTHI